MSKTKKHVLSRLLAACTALAALAGLVAATPTPVHAATAIYHYVDAGNAPQSDTSFATAAADAKADSTITIIGDTDDNVYTFSQINLGGKSLTLNLGGGALAWTSADTCSITNGNLTVEKGVLTVNNLSLDSGSGAVTLSLGTGGRIAVDGSTTTGLDLTGGCSATVNSVRTANVGVQSQGTAVVLGDVVSTGSYGVVAQSGGTVTVGGNVSGALGVLLYDGGTVTVEGTLTGGSDGYIQFMDAGSKRVNLVPSDGRPGTGAEEGYLVYDENCQTCIDAGFSETGYKVLVRIPDETEAQTAPGQTAPAEAPAPASAGPRPEDPFEQTHYDFWLPVLTQLNALGNTGTVTVDVPGNITHVRHFIFDALVGTNRTLTMAHGGETYTIHGKPESANGTMGSILLGHNHLFVGNLDGYRQ